MIRKTVVRKNRYFDSVFLMQVARRIAAEPGITDASAMLATEANRTVLAGIGYGEAGRDPEFAAAGPNDLIIAVEGEERAVLAVIADPESRLQRPAAVGGTGRAGTGGTGTGGAGGTAEPRTLAEAVAMRPDAGVAVISVPGEHAAREARAALNAGLNVFLFSSNVSVQDELALKTDARGRGLIVMGPDCGTTFVGGAGIGFANAVRRGPIGVVGSSGTGMQEFTCMVHQAGSGISHAIGTGSRDLSEAVGGISTMTALDALEEDRETRVIAVISKPPGEATAARLQERLAHCSKPVVLCLLGSARDHGGRTVSNGIRYASTLDDAVTLALAAAGAAQAAGARGGGSEPSREEVFRELRSRAEAEASRFGPGQRYVRGLFAGGTFCYQAQSIFRDAGITVYSNSPLPGMPSLEDARRSRENSLVDMGSEEFVEGRPHPMIDSMLRGKRLEEEGQDPAVAVILLDFILGAISSRDPAADLVDAIARGKEAARARGGHICVVASVCGTEGDAQGLAGQRKKLEEAGVVLMPSAAAAAVFSLEVLLALRRRTGVR